jgi:hypothetical protein
MAGSQELTTIVTVAGIQEGPPPRLVWHKRLKRSNGAEKIFSQALLIPNDVLHRRLLDEVGPGDELEITSVTEWGEGYIRSYLTDFKKLGPAQPTDAGRPTLEATRTRSE